MGTTDIWAIVVARFYLRIFRYRRSASQNPTFRHPPIPSPHNNPIARILLCPFVPTIIWSCTAMFSRLPASMIWRVTSMS